MTEIICVPTRGQVLDVVRTSGSTVGYIVFQPSERSYAVQDITGRVIKAGMSLTAAQEYAMAEVTW